MRKFLNPKKEEIRSKTKESTQKSRLAWFGRIMSIITSDRPKEELWEDLEEILISADSIINSLALKGFTKIKNEYRIIIKILFFIDFNQ